MLVFLLICVERLEGLAFGAVDVDARRIVAEDPLAAGDEVDAVVRLGAADVMLQLDHAALHGADEADIEVAFLVDLLLARIAGGELILPILLEPGGDGTHRDEGIEAVAAVDVHVVCHGTQAVSRIEIAIAIEVLEAAPLAFALGGEKD